MKRNAKKLVALAAALALFATACSSSGSTPTDPAEGGDDGTTETAATGETLAAVKAADVVKCGTRDALPGFAKLEDNGDRSGFDVDFCRVIAAAVLGDAEKVEFVDLETPERFTALQTKKVDVLVRNTTYTATRDGLEQATFVTPNFYDGQGMAVPGNSSATSLEDIANDATICVASGTTTEGNVADKSDELGKNWNVKAFDEADLAVADFEAGNCEGWSADKSQLVSLGSDLDPVPTIFEDTFSREPLAPAVLDGDSEWAQVVNWAVNVTIYAEELDVTQANIESLKDSDDANIQKLFGKTTDDDGNEIEFAPALGLPSDFAYQVISQVGNYNDIYERNLTPLGLERAGSLNDLAVNGEGGVHYAIPLK